MMTRRFKVLFTLSVLFNLLLVGIMAGHMTHSLWPGGPFGDISELASRLPDDKRELFHQAIDPAMRDAETIHQQIASDKKTAAHILSTDPFDETALLTEFDHMDNLHRQMKRRMTDAIVQLAHTFTLPERQVLADMVSRSAPPGCNGPRGGGLK